MTDTIQKNTATADSEGLVSRTLARWKFWKRNRDFQLIAAKELIRRHEQKIEMLQRRLDFIVQTRVEQTQLDRYPRGEMVRICIHVNREEAHRWPQIWKHAIKDVLCKLSAELNVNPPSF